MEVFLDLLKVFIFKCKFVGIFFFLNFIFLYLLFSTGGALSGWLCCGLDLFSRLCGTDYIFCAEWYNQINLLTALVIVTTDPQDNVDGYPQYDPKDLQKKKKILVAGRNLSYHGDDWFFLRESSFICLFIDIKW